MKRSKAYLINGVVIFIAWLVGQIIADLNIFVNQIYVEFSFFPSATCLPKLFAGCQNTFVRVHVLSCLLAL